MAKRVLSVGNCGMDDGNLRRVLHQHFAADVDAVDSATEALEKLQDAHYDLVLVNRVFDTNGDSGLRLIKTLKGDTVLRQVPVMLVSNYPDAQAEALAAGALPGFGKKIVGKPQLVEHLKSIFVA
jgi:CheY-like chemotaxis protein